MPRTDGPNQVSGELVGAIRGGNKSGNTRHALRIAYLERFSGQEQQNINPMLLRCMA